MRTLLVLLWSLLALLFQVDDIPLVQYRMFVALVISCKFTPADFYFLTQCLEGVTFSGYQVIVVIELLDRVQYTLCIDGLVGATMCCHKSIISLCFVIIEKFIEFNDLYQFVGILWIGCISALFQTSSPAFVIALVKFKQAGIAWLPSQKFAMILIAISGILIYSETFASGIVIVVLGWTSPVVAFDAKMVVTL